MIEQIAAVTRRDVSRETFKKLESYVVHLCDESANQNLISRSTLDHVWDRHILDSAQLAGLAPTRMSWIDIGSGAGLPGIVISILSDNPMTLVEPRRLRADFLAGMIAELQLDAEVLHRKAEQVTGKYDVVTARAVAPLPKLLSMTFHLSHAKTLWVLPKGRSAKSELAEAERSWHYDLRVEPSCTDPDSSILLLSKVRAKR
jgi:16S rRNA (guanine527-N7)-methyltransferase